MKTKSLQIGKAMSAALFVLLLSVVGMKNALAQNQVATLQHNDSLFAFYGPNALSEAHGAAANGDIITLSSGTFQGCQIAKSITIHGAGCVFDPLTNVLPTKISSSLTLSYCTNTTFEGIWFVTVSVFNSNYICFKKCNIDEMHDTSTPNKNGFQFINCIVKSFSSPRFHGTTITNSIVKYADYSHTDIYNKNNIYNSVILFNNGKPIKNMDAFNSIITTISGHEVSNCTFNNCIGIKTGETSLFEGQTVQNVMEVNSYEDVFETFVGTVFYENWYQLKEEIATEFLGQDGTEVGIYGGMMPYNPRPTYMVIKRCNVAPRSTVDGKLSVDIEVLTEGE